MRVTAWPTSPLGGACHHLVLHTTQSRENGSGGVFEQGCMLV